MADALMSCMAVRFLICVIRGVSFCLPSGSHVKWGNENGNGNGQRIETEKRIKSRVKEPRRREEMRRRAA